MRDRYPSFATRMKMLNDKGSRMDPYGTPIDIDCQLESVSESHSLESIWLVIFYQGSYSFISSISY